MPSLRQKVTTYFRQFSFIAEREDRPSANGTTPDGSFITRYLDGSWKPPDSIPPVISGKEPSDLPEFGIGKYGTGIETVTAAYTGPDEGLTAIHRTRVHLSAGPEIDFIDTHLDQDTHTATNIPRKPFSTSRVCSTIDPNANKRGPTKKDESLTSTSVLGQRCHKNANMTIVAGSNEQSILNQTIDHVNDNNVIKDSDNISEPIANVRNWKQSTDHAYGISVSLYEKNCLSGDNIGNPVADCFGILARGNSCIMALADGVNWGEGARLAARCAVQGTIDYLNSAIFGIHNTTSTKDIFVSLIRSFWEAHAYIMEVGAALTTLTVSVVLPLSDDPGKYIVCCCNVGDSLGYVYSRKHGVREITEGSHDLNTMRDMRDALGALGPVHGDKPEMSNLTLSLTVVEESDIVFLTSDGISDNFDPVVGKFAEPATNRAQAISSSLMPSQHADTKSSVAPKHRNINISSNVALKSKETSNINHVSTCRPSVSNRQPPQQRPVSGNSSLETSRCTYRRSKTFIEPRVRTNHGKKLPLVTGTQRHQLTLLRMADLLVYGINGTPRPSTTAKQLCQLLVDFATCITSAKRKLLEQRELFHRVITDKDGRRKEVECNKQQQKIIRKRMTEGNTFCSLPGKLDHASIVAYTIGAKRTYSETNL